MRALGGTRAFNRALLAGVRLRAGVPAAELALAAYAASPSSAPWTSKHRIATPLSGNVVCTRAIQYGHGVFRRAGRSRV